MSKVDQANEKAIKRMMESRPVLVDIGRAKDVIPGMKDNLFLHAGPPITWDRMSGPLKGAIMGGLLFEKKADSLEEAENIASSGKIEFAPCHHHDSVGPMAGVITPSMMVYIVEDKKHGNKTYSNINEGYGKVLRMGAYDSEVISRLEWLNEVYAHVVREALQLSEGVDLNTLMAQALHMGDDCHNRNRANNSLFVRMMAPYVIESELGQKKEYNSLRIDLTKIFPFFKGRKPMLASEVLAFMHSNDIGTLNFIMAACKAITMSAHGIKNCSIVTTMSRNGTDFGIRVSGTGEQWFTAPADYPQGLFFSGFSSDDANKDIGDSVITETAGLGGFAMAAAPAIVNFVGGKPSDALDATSEMYEITVIENNIFTIPTLNFRGTPTGIDVRKVVEKNILPKINTGIAHKDPGIGQVGAGIIRPPMEIFVSALKELGNRI